MKVRDVMQRDVTTINEDQELSLALQIMLWRQIRHIPVLRAGRVVGLLSERDVLQHRPEGGSSMTVRGAVRDAMTAPAETIHPYAPLADASAMLSTGKLGCLPVVDDGELVGMLTTTDLLAAMAQVRVPRPHPVTLCADDIMTTRIFAVHPGDALADAAALMSRHGVRHLPVVDGIHRVVGILSDRDVRTAIGDPGVILDDSERMDRLNRYLVESAMTADPRTCGPDTNMADLVVAFADERFGALPVVDEADRLLGIISYVDVLRALAERPGE